MNDTNKLFLIIWIPIMLIVSYGIYHSLNYKVNDSSLYKGAYTNLLQENIEMSGIYPQRDRNLNDLIFPYIILFTFSIILYIIISIGDTKPKIE